MKGIRQRSQDGPRTNWSDASNRRGKKAVSEEGYLHFLTHTWREFLNSFAPMGYEDDAGFHYGDKPERQ